jgi:hypothetical protein
VLVDHDPGTAIDGGQRSPPNHRVAVPERGHEVRYRRERYLRRNLAAEEPGRLRPHRLVRILAQRNREAARGRRLGVTTLHDGIEEADLERRLRRETRTRALGR